MPRHAERRVLAYTPEQLFDLVVDVEQYPEFLPWCIGAAVTARHEKSFVADLAIGFHALKTSYVSKVEFERPSRIDVALVQGPFRHLDNRWQFSDAGPGRTEIAFEVDFEFRSLLFSKMMTPIFGGAVKRMIREFESRAKHLYA